MLIRRLWLVLIAGYCPCVSMHSLAVEPSGLFRIQVVDQENGWPVPAVELRTTHHVRLMSDNAGVIAFDLPELMNRSTWLSVEGEGYTVEPDGFGFRGVRVMPKAGEQQTIN